MLTYNIIEKFAKIRKKYNNNNMYDQPCDLIVQLHNEFSSLYEPILKRIIALMTIRDTISKNNFYHRQLK